MPRVILLKESPDRFSSADGGPVVHSFTTCEESEVLSYWDRLEACISGLRKEDARAVFPGVVASEIIGRVWATRHELTPGQRIELGRRIPGEKELSAHEVEEIAKDTGIPTEQVGCFSGVSKAGCFHGRGNLPGGWFLGRFDVAITRICYRAGGSLFLVAAGVETTGAPRRSKSCQAGGMKRGDCFWWSQELTSCSLRLLGQIE